MIASVIQELGIDMNDVVLERNTIENIVAYQNVIERLRVTLKDVAVPLFLREFINQRLKLVALKCFHGFRELKVVYVSHNDYICVRVYRQDLVDKVIDDLGLSITLSFSNQRWWLKTPEERLVRALSDKVVGDDEKRTSV